MRYFSCLYHTFSWYLVPRLGVGASVSEERSFVREAARLKYKLEGKKKRPRDEQGVDVKQVQSDNEEESRTGAIKKKARTDPSGTLFKRRKNSDNGKTQSTVHPMALEATLPKLSLLEKDGTKVDGVARNFTIPITLENNKEIKLESPVHHAEKRAVQIKTTSQLISKSPATSKLSNIFMLSQPSARDISKLSTLPPAVTSSNSRRNISLTSDSTLPYEDFTTDTSFPQQPLLNLRGSPSEPESDPAGHSRLTSKKKRRRRKRKKFLQTVKTPLCLKIDGATSVS